MSITDSMELKSNTRADAGGNMEEKTYKTMSRSGAMDISLGVIITAVGITCGVLLMVSGAKLLKVKSKILF